MTDHRAEADAWLDIAHNNWLGGGGGADPQAATPAALIGIGYALLALSEPDLTHDGEDDPFARTMPRAPAPPLSVSEG